jgi:LysM repeat protein
MQRSGSDERAAFSLYLRTGRRVAVAEMEVKFNPWHDEEDGRFTFAGQGRYFGGGGASGSWAEPQQARRDDKKPIRPNSPHHPNNHSVHVVRGDTLTRIAALRKGLTAGDLAWLNQQSVDQPLWVGQPIKLPHQAYLDAGRVAKNRFMALAYYMDTHGGKLPPNVAHLPSLESQILDGNWRRETKNGYDFHIDIAARTRHTYGQLSLAVSISRSRRNQARAGKPDRRATDDGGHFIAARFNGPPDGFNHFAQDASFNRGAYRAMEDRWAKELRGGHKVFVDILPLYHGISKRPYELTVTWFVDGRRFKNKFPNEGRGTQDGER